jgi:hypothetical protein
MSRKWSRPLSAAALIACALALPAIGQKSGASDYWPLKAGNSWTLETAVMGQKNEQILAVKSVTPEKNGSLVELTYTNPRFKREIQKEIYRVDKTGVYRVAYGPNAMHKVTPPAPVLLYPLSAGKKWKWEGMVHTSPMIMTCAVSGPETIETPAGKFKALKIHTVLRLKSGAEPDKEADMWVAPGVGMVQRRSGGRGMVADQQLTRYTVQK